MTSVENSVENDNNLVAQMVHRATQTPGQTAITLDESAICYDELLAQVQQVAAHVACISSDSQPRVALLSPNRLESLPVFLGTAMAGGLTLVLSPSWSLTQLRQVLAAHRPHWLVGESPLLALLGVDLPSETLDRPLQTGWPPLPPLTTPQKNPQQPFYACFTSGTTGSPKGVVKTHRSWVAGLAASRIEFQITAADQVLVPGSLSHSLSLYAAVEALSAGSTLHLLAQPSGAAALASLHQRSASVIVAVPTLLSRLATEAIAHNQPCPAVRLIISGGAKLTGKVLAQLQRAFPSARIVEYYGASELGFVSVRHSNMPVDSVGRAFAGVALSVQREDGNGPADVGKIGWVCVRSELICAGYLDQPTTPPATGFRAVNGWWTAGDRGWLDGQGYLYLAGREQDMMICAGVNVYPAEVEAALLTLPEIAAAAVLGISNDCRGDMIYAVVVWQEQPLDRRTLRQRLRPHLPRYACPRRVYALDQLPLTSSGKVARAQLAEQLQRGLLAAAEVR